MERVNIRQQNLDELYQTPEKTLESTHPPLCFVLGQADPVVEVSPHSSFPLGIFFSYLTKYAGAESSDPWYVP